MTGKGVVIALSQSPEHGEGEALQSLAYIRIASGLAPLETIKVAVFNCRHLSSSQIH